MSVPAVADELDTCGLLCPLPVLKARKRLGGMAPGALLRVLADDPAARVDFPHFCAEQGHELVSAGEFPEDGAPARLVFVIRKKRSA
jgi:tRNA 2-thiouridine synthesizing protein A